MKRLKFVSIGTGIILLVLALFMTVEYWPESTSTEPEIQYYYVTEFSDGRFGWKTVQGSWTYNSTFTHDTHEKAERAMLACTGPQPQAIKETQIIFSEAREKNETPINKIP